MWLLEHTNKRPDENIQKTIDTVVEDAKDKWGLKFEGEYPTNGIGISTLRPVHVETATLPNPTRLNSWRIAIAAVQTWQDWVNVALDQNTYVINAGIFDITPNPAMTECGFRANGQDLPVQNIESMFAFEKPLAFWSKPFAVSPENNLTARIYGNVAQTELAGFLGFAVAKRLILIAES